MKERGFLRIRFGLSITAIVLLTQTPSFAGDTDAGKWAHQDNELFLIRKCYDLRTTCISSASCVGVFGAIAVATMGMDWFSVTMAATCSAMLSGTSDYCEECSQPDVDDDLGDDDCLIGCDEGPLSGIVNLGNPSPLIANALSSAGTAITNVQNLSGDGDAVTPADAFVTTDSQGQGATAGGVVPQAEASPGSSSAARIQRGGTGTGSGGGGISSSGFDSSVGTSAASDESQGEGTTSGDSAASGYGSKGSSGALASGKYRSKGGDSGISGVKAGALGFGENGNDSSINPMSSEDPEDYFTRISQNESLFEIVHKRYQTKVRSWVAEDTDLEKKKLSKPK